jgi:hypothetical protein
MNTITLDDRCVGPDNVRDLLTGNHAEFSAISDNRHSVELS